MARILLMVAAWLVKKLGLLLVIVIALLLAPPLQELWVVVRDFDPERIAGDLTTKVARSVPAKGAPSEDVDRALQGLQARLAARTSELDAIKAERPCFLPKCGLVRAARMYPLDVEIQLLAQALAYTGAMHQGALKCVQERRASQELADARVEEADVSSRKPPLFLRTTEHEALIARIRELEGRVPTLAKACSAYRNLGAFAPRSVQEGLGDRYKESLGELGMFKGSQSWLFTSIEAILPTALLVLAAVIALPIGVKLVSYYVIAPLASRRFGVRLMPEASGDVSLASPSSALQRIELDDDSELLIRPSLLRSSPDDAAKRTKLLLDGSMPFTCLIARLYLLTRITTAGKGVVTIGAGEDALGELAVIELGESCALVLQPRCLVGVVQHRDHPLRITRHWRLGSLGGWLTLQLRYLVFHGPASLIVRGRRGVAIDPAQVGAGVNQLSTLGFSANLDYRVARCETYFAYHTGQQALFNDSFAAGDGWYVHEVHPAASGSALLPGRGVEGLLNSVLKVFGI